MSDKILAGAVSGFDSRRGGADWSLPLLSAAKVRSRAPRIPSGLCARRFFRCRAQLFLVTDNPTFKER